MVLKFILFIVLGFILLIKGADFFVDGAVAVATKLGIPHIVVGLTIVAFGTSAPEAAVSIKSALAGVNGIAVGNVLGSNLINVLVILGLTSCVVTLNFKEDTVKIDLPFLIAVSILLPVLGLTFHAITLPVGLLFWALLIGYLTFLVKKAISTEMDEDENQKELNPALIVLFILGGIAAIILGSNLAVEGARGIASMLGVSDRVIGLTVVALGTSLPELMTSLTAARKGNADIAVGNIVGSNLFNILFILGTTSLIRPIPFGPEYLVDSVLGIVAVTLLFVFAAMGRKLKRVHGVIFIVIYSVYLYFLIRG